MVSLQRILHAIVTYGEAPEAREHRGVVWEAHLNELRTEFGARAWTAELIRGCVGHLWWRVTVSGTPTSLPVGFACILLAITTLGLVASPFDDLMSTPAALHSSLVFLILGLALCIRPWVLSWRRIAPAALFAATGPFHLAVTNQFSEWFDYVLAASQMSVAIGLAYIGVSGLRSRTPFGATRFGLAAIVIGGLAAAGAHFMWAVQSGDIGYEISAALFSWGAVFGCLRFLDLWAMQAHPGAASHRLAGGGRRRHQNPQVSQRSPLFVR